jgi:hypothetical protein
MDKRIEIKFMEENELFLYNPRKSMESGRVAHSFLISARDAGVWSASGPGRLSTDRKLRGSQCLVLLWKEEKSLAVSGNQITIPRISSP